MSIPNDSGLENFTEYDFQKENGVLDALNEHEHITYSYWPSTYAIKSKVKMNFYNQPTFNFKLECELNPEKSFDALEKFVLDAEKS